MKGLLVGTAALFLVVGCGSVTPVVSGGYKLYTAASNSGSMQLAVIDSHSQAVERKLQIGTPSSDWKHLYSVMSNSLIDTNPETGTTVRTLQLSRHYELPEATISGVPGGLSHNGKWLVLQAFDQTAGVPTASHLLLVDTSFSSGPVPIELKGYFGFDAISNDGRNLFLLQYVAPQRYHVRLYRIAQKELDPTVIVEKGASPTNPMAGIKLMSVPSPDGEWLFTMYVRENEGAFVHGLQLNGNPFAACIDLPGVGLSKDQNEWRWSLAVNPERSAVYAANGPMGLVAEIKLNSNQWPELKRTWKIAPQQSASNFLFQNVQAKEVGSSAAAVSPDGKTLITSGGTGLLWLDTDTFRTRTQALVGWRIGSVALTPDGRTVYALSDSGHIVELSTASGNEVAKFNPAAGYPVALMRVAKA
jgi:hypothetical protein